MASVVVELFFEVIHVEALIKGAGDPLVIFCPLHKASHTSDTFKEGPFKEESTEADYMVSVMIASNDLLETIANHVASLSFADIFFKDGKVGADKAVVGIG